MLKGSLFSIIFAVERQMQQSDSHSELAFLELVLHGNASFSGLYRLSKFYTSETCFQAVDLVLKQGRLQQSHQRSFQLFLHTLLHDLKCFNTKSQQLISDRKHPKVSKGFAKRHDRINKETDETFSGMLIAPLTQRFDIRLGEAKGACAGYVYAWLSYFLKGKEPFGIPYDKPYLKPIPFNSNLGFVCPELNHCIPVNYEIADYQARLLHGSLIYGDETARLFKLTLRQSSPLSMRCFIADLQHIFSHHENRGLYVSLRCHNKAHAIGFYRDKQHAIHFLDANAGWFVFKSDTRFNAWLKFYFKQRRYDMTYMTYSIFEQCLTRPSQDSSRMKPVSKITAMKSYSAFCMRQSLGFMKMSLPKKSPVHKIQEPRFFRSQSLPDLNQLEKKDAQRLMGDISH